MDEDLLEKYFAGQCTPQEAALVRRWLDQPIENEEELLKQSWRNIQKHMRVGIIRPINSAARYLVAASIGILTISGAIWKAMPQDFLIKNTSSHYEAFDAEGLLFRLPPQAFAHVNMGIIKRRANLIFCGDVRIHNTSENDVEMKLRLDCASVGHSEHTAVVKVRKDGKYVAFQCSLISNELIVVEEDRLFDLPLPLQKKAMEALKI